MFRGSGGRGNPVHEGKRGAFGGEPEPCSRARPSPPHLPTARFFLPGGACSGLRRAGARGVFQTVPLDGRCHRSCSFALGSAVGRPAAGQPGALCDCAAWIAGRVSGHRPHVHHPCASALLSAVSSGAKVRRVQSPRLFSTQRARAHAHTHTHTHTCVHTHARAHTPNDM